MLKKKKPTNLFSGLLLCFQYHAYTENHIDSPPTPHIFWSDEHRNLHNTQVEMKELFHYIQYFTIGWWFFLLLNVRWVLRLFQVSLNIRVFFFCLVYSLKRNFDKSSQVILVSYDLFPKPAKLLYKLPNQ